MFVKEQAYRFNTQLDSGTMDDVIPRDYAHAFLVRSPARSVPSFYKMTLDMGFELLEQARAGEDPVRQTNGLGARVGGRLAGIVIKWLGCWGSDVPVRGRGGHRGRTNSVAPPCIPTKSETGPLCTAISYLTDTQEHCATSDR